MGTYPHHTPGHEQAVSETLPPLWMGLQSPQFTEVVTRVWEQVLLGTGQAAGVEETVALPPAHNTRGVLVTERGDGVPS